MKTLFTLFLLFYSCFITIAQNPSWQWGKSAGGAANDLGYAISTDANGKSYTTGRFNSSATFGSLSATSYGGPDVYVSKYDTYGNCLWVKHGGSIDAMDIYGDEGRGIDIDPAGNCYVTGTFKTVATFGPFTLSYPVARRGIFVVKYDSSGNELWARKDTGGMSNNYSRAITVDASGSSYITGYLGGGTNYFGTHTLIGAGAFVVKYDSSGTAVYATKLAKFGGIDAYGISVDADNNVYVTGYLQGTDSINGQAFTSSGNRDVFLIKVDASGNFQWLKQSRSIPGTYAYGEAVAVDMQGNPLVAGHFDNVVQFGTTTLSIASGGFGGDECFIAKFDPAGNSLWAKQSMAASHSGGTEAHAITSDSKSNACITGVYRDTVNFDNRALSYYGTQTFVALYDSSGNCQWVLGSRGQNPGAFGQGISTDNQGSYYVTGYDKYSPVFGNDTPPAYGQEDIFVAKIGPVQCSPFSIDIFSGDSLICASDSVLICAATIYINYLWNNGSPDQCITTSQAGNYYVTVTDVSGCTAESNHLAIAVLPLPPVSISVNGDTLSVFDAVTQQWYLNGSAINGATAPLYIATQSGSYTVAVTDTNGCVATSSAVIISGVDNLKEEDMVSVYQLTVGSWQLTVGNNFVGGTAEVFDANGRVVFQSEIRNPQSEIALSAARGVYLLRISSSKSSVVRKLVRL